MIELDRTAELQNLLSDTLYNAKQDGDLPVVWVAALAEMLYASIQMEFQGVARAAAIQLVVDRLMEPSSGQEKGV